MTESKKERLVQAMRDAAMSIIQLTNYPAKDVDFYKVELAYDDINEALNELHAMRAFVKKDDEMPSRELVRRGAKRPID